jgi:hypothetical protein
VGADRGFAYVESECDLLDGEAVAEILKDRVLAGGEIGGIARYGVNFKFATDAINAVIYD